MEINGGNLGHITPIIQLTNECNMACRYCYAGSASGTSPDVAGINQGFTQHLARLNYYIDQVLHHNADRPTRIIFHGGEPLLLSWRNWDLMLNQLSKKKCKLMFGVQTNGVLLNEEFADLFKDYQVEVGVSLDGPNYLNDIVRVLKTGEGTFSTVFANILKLQERSLSFGVLSTLSKVNIGHVEEIYSFFKSYHIPFTLRPVFQTKNGISSRLLITPDEYARAVCSLFDLWFDDENADTYIVDEFTSMIAQFIRPIEGLVSCNFTKACSSHFLSFDLAGNVYPCNRFCGDTHFFCGNILDEDLEKILGGLPKVLSSRWQKLSEGVCSRCEISQWCYGGCPANAQYAHGDYFGRDYYCPAYRKIFKHVYERVKSSIDN
jgi:uncharacterized protein